jgi:MraZ protein
MALFTGDYDTQINAKRRLAICSALRESVDTEDGSRWYAVIGKNRKLWLYPEGLYRELAKSFEQTLLPTKELDSVRRLFAMTTMMNPDAQGRVILNEKSMRRTGLTTGQDVTLVGMQDHIEIWSTSDWQADEEAFLLDYPEVLEEAAQARAKAKADASKGVL